MPRIGALHSTGVVAIALVVAWTSTAHAECARPTDPPPGYAGYAYGDHQVRSFDSAHVRVWYTLTGANAVRSASTRADGAPDDVAEVSLVAETALERFAARGYRRPLSDAEPSCGSHGGDERLDVYLVDFAAADGATVTERGTGGSGTRRTCASFVLVEARMDLRYSTGSEGFRTVVPHELFHAVQNAYDTTLDPFFGEGTAQLVTKRIYPDLSDLERLLPAFFAEPSRALDTPGGGVTAGFYYGSAVWPLFLEERFGHDVVREIFDGLASTGGPVLDATARLLESRQTTLGAAFLDFVTWNVATGRRAGDGGYPDAKAYPEVPVVPLVSGSTALSGLAARYYRVSTDVPQGLRIDADGARVGARFVPIDGRVAKLSLARSLPTNVDGDGILVVAGLTTSKADAPFAVRLGEPIPSPVPEPPPRETPPAEPATPIASHGDGCTLHTSTNGPDAFTLLAPITLLAARARRRGAKS